MEVNQAIKLVEDNFKLNSDESIKLLGMLQELQQYRANPLLSVQAATERQITVSQAEMEYIQQLEQAAQVVIKVYKDPDHCSPPEYTRMGKALNKLTAALQEGYE